MARLMIACAALQTANALTLSATPHSSVAASLRHDPVVMMAKTKKAPKLVSVILESEVRSPLDLVAS